MRAAKRWLQARPLLGVDVFARPLATPPREGGYVALLEACLMVLRGREPPPESEAAVYRPRGPDLWRAADAMARIRTMLADNPAGGDLAVFLPPMPADALDPQIKARAAVASTLVAGLELAREGEIVLIQEQRFGEIILQAVA